MHIRESDFIRTLRLKFNLLNLLTSQRLKLREVLIRYYVSCLQNSSEFSRVLHVLIRILQCCSGTKDYQTLKQEF